jgi:hypothetical protein
MRDKLREAISSYLKKRGLPRPYLSIVTCHYLLVCRSSINLSVLLSLRVPHQMRDKLREAISNYLENKWIVSSLLASQ